MSMAIPVLVGHLEQLEALAARVARDRMLSAIGMAIMPGRPVVLATAAPVGRRVPMVLRGWMEVL